MRTRRSKVVEEKVNNEEGKGDEINSDLASPLKKRRSRIKLNEQVDEPLLTDKSEEASSQPIDEEDMLSTNDLENTETVSIVETVSAVEDVTIETNVVIEDNEIKNDEIIASITVFESKEEEVFLFKNESKINNTFENDLDNKNVLNITNVVSPVEDTVKLLNPIEDIVPGEEDFQPNFEGDEEFDSEDVQKPNLHIDSENLNLDIGLSSDIDTLASINEEKKINHDNFISETNISDNLDQPLNKESKDVDIQSPIIHVSNLVRPFTLRQLKELFHKYGDFDDENDFWIDKIKSHCIIKFQEISSAVNALNELNGQKWPSSNPKILKVEFTDEQMLDQHRGSDASLTPQAEFRKSTGDPNQSISEINNSNLNGGESGGVTTMDPHDFKLQKNLGPLLPRTPEGLARSRRIVIKGESSSDGRRERLEVSPFKDNKGCHVEGSARTTTPPARVADHPDYGSAGGPKREDRHSAHAPSHEVPVHVKEWDRGKVMDIEKYGAQEYGATGTDVKEEKVAPTKSGQLMDELFSKTHTLPCVYWLPLTVKQMEAKIKELGVAYVYEKDIINLSHSCRTYQAYPYENLGRKKQGGPAPVAQAQDQQPYETAGPQDYAAPYNQQGWGQAPPHNTRDRWTQGQDWNHNPFPPMVGVGPGEPIQRHPPAAPQYDPAYQPRNFLSRDFDYARRKRPHPPPAYVENAYREPIEPGGSSFKAGPDPKRPKLEPERRDRNQHRSGDGDRSFKREGKGASSRHAEKRPDRSTRENLNQSRKGGSRDGRSHRR